jgi:exosortase
VLVSTSSPKHSPRLSFQKVRDREGAITSTRGACASPKHSRFASRANLVSFASVQNLATLQKTADASPLSGRHFSVGLALSILSLGVLWFVLWRQLSGEWSVNEQYNFGWFVPFFAVYLFWLRWQDGPPLEVRGQKSEVRSRTLIASAIAIVSLFLLLPVRLFEIANPEWRPLGWIHAASVATLTLLYLWWIGGRRWVRHFAFPVAFIFVAVPWPTQVEVPVIQGLMRIVAHVAAETAMLLGIPAQVEGNLIRVSTGLVGVNEACSGIRSLQTALMIGLLFGELKRLSVLRRVALVVGAVVIALLANFIRAVFLVSVAATKNISEVGRWHDIAGYAIVGLVFVGTMGLAYWLGSKKSSNAVVAEPALGDSRMGVPAKPKPGEGWSLAESRTLQPARLPLQFPAFSLVAALCWLLFVEIGTAAWYRAHESNLVTSRRWEVQWPENVTNFHELKIDDEVRRQLRFDRGIAASWTWPASRSPEGSHPSGSERITCVLYFFRWNPGRNSVLLANFHRPDVCLPATGWVQVTDTGVRNYPISESFSLPFRHFEFHHGTRANGSQQIAHAFHCLWEDRALNPSAAGANPAQMSGSRSSWTRAERLRAVLQGRRHLGQQMMEFVAFPHGTADLAEINARFANALPGLVKVDY